jgi:NAD+ synthase
MFGGFMALEPKLPADAADIIKHFIISQVESAGASGVVIGLSGGLDSAVVAKLSIDALGKKKVACLILPEKGTNKKDVEHAKLVSEEIGIKPKTIEVSGPVESFRKILKTDRSRLANVKARCRMITLYDEAKRFGRLVAGTGNKSEILVGYFTKYGDGGSDILPIGDLYKTQVRLLAKEIDIPKPIISKPPSAGLWKGQTDEGEMGITYSELDRILVGIELGLRTGEIEARTGIKKALVEKVEAMVAAARHKRVPVPIPKIGIKTVGWDWKD